MVDASILARFILREEGWEKARDLLASSTAVTVDHALKEVLNAIWKAVRRGLIGHREAREKARALTILVEKGVVTVEPEDSVLTDAFRLALETGITVYDALYVALALAKKATLATCDARQAEAARQVGVNTRLLA
ncbi:PilT protein domain protein [Pyrolobus fumarii 1A]|uniref:Ribonuclease VapC n=1 Tax=Pyrolobus fumarii (strain DSM 11204 / 1A) TaxID=694429 RepID=G0EGX3_PYRF1|nr:PilT protein domain protein [Pyrolobus fumarii 1A]